MKLNFRRVSVKLSALLLVIYIVAVVARPSLEADSDESNIEDDDDDDDDEDKKYEIPPLPSYVILTDAISDTHMQSFQDTVGYLDKFVRRFIMPHLDPDLPGDHFPDWMVTPSPKPTTEVDLVKPAEQHPELSSPPNAETDQQTDPAMPTEQFPDWITSPNEDTDMIDAIMPEEQIFIPPELPMFGFLRPESTKKPKPSAAKKPKPSAAKKPKPSATKKPKPTPAQEEKPLVAENVTTDDDDMIQVDPEMLRPEKIRPAVTGSTTTPPVVERTTVATDPAVPEPAPVPPVEQEMHNLPMIPLAPPQEPVQVAPPELSGMVPPVIIPETLLRPERPLVPDSELPQLIISGAAVEPSLAPEFILPPMNEQSEIPFDPVFQEGLMLPDLTDETATHGLPMGPALPSELFGPSDMISGVVDPGMVSAPKPQFEDVALILAQMNQPAKEPAFIGTEVSTPEPVKETPIITDATEQSAVLLPDEVITQQQIDQEIMDLPSMIASIIAAEETAPITMPDIPTDLATSFPGEVTNIPEVPAEPINVAVEPVGDIQPALAIVPMEPVAIQQNQYEMPAAAETLETTALAEQSILVDPSLAETFPPPVVVGSEPIDPMMIDTPAEQTEHMTPEAVPSAALTMEAPADQLPISFDPVLAETFPPPAIVDSESTDPMVMDVVMLAEPAAIKPDAVDMTPVEPELIVDEPHDPVDNLREPAEGNPDFPKEPPLIQMLLLEESVHPTARGLPQERKETPVLTCHNCTIRVACTDCVKFRPDLVLSDPSAFPMTITTPGLEIVAEPNIHEILANYSELNPARMAVIEMSNVDATIKGNQVTVETTSEKEMAAAAKAENIMMPNMQGRMMLEEAGLQADTPLVVDEPIPIEIPVSMTDTPIRPEAVKVMTQPTAEERTMAGHDSVIRTKRSLPVQPNMVLKATLRRLI